MMRSVASSFLLFDVGNTRLKWASVQADALQVGEPLAYADEDLTAGLARRLRDVGRPQQVWMACVAGAVRAQELAQFVQQRFGCEINFVHSVASACGVFNAYAEPHRLGVDRFLALIAVHAYCQTPALLVSCGTALTLDVLTPDGRHHGGLICASPALMQSALFGRAAQLQPQADTRLVALADNTGDAIDSGTWLAAVALVERVYAQTRERFGASSALVIGGGAAVPLQAALGGIGQLDADLVLRGLLRYAMLAPR